MQGNAHVYVSTYICMAPAHLRSRQFLPLALARLMVMTMHGHRGPLTRGDLGSEGNGSEADLMPSDERMAPAQHRQA